MVAVVRTTMVCCAPSSGWITVGLNCSFHVPVELDRFQVHSTAYFQLPATGSVQVRVAATVAVSVSERVAVPGTTASLVAFRSAATVVINCAAACGWDVSAAASDTRPADQSAAKAAISALGPGPASVGVAGGRVHPASTVRPASSRVRTTPARPRCSRAARRVTPASIPTPTCDPPS